MDVVLVNTKKINGYCYAVNYRMNIANII